MLHYSKFRSQLKATASVLALPIGLAAASTSASAQEASTDAADDNIIIVTATRRAESVQDIPINIAAVGSDQIEEQGFDDISELVAFVPGINVADQGGRDGNRIVVRGLNADPIASAFGQEDGGGSVATYVGDIPLFVDLRLNDLQRVEVLLGPQGTLYGAGTLGGAIRYIPNKPNFSGIELEARADAYTYKEGDGISSDLGFTFNLPLSESFAVRGSFDYLNDKGFIDYPFVVQQPGVSNPDPDFTNAAERDANFSPIEDANTEEILGGRIAARWQPIDAIDATLTYYFQLSEYGGRNTSSFRTTTIPSDRYEFGGRVAEPNERDSQLLALEVTADLGFAELTSATGYATVKENGQRDQTDLLISLEYSYETFPTFTAFTFEDEETEIFNQELRLVSKGDGPLNWIVGAFYNRNKYNALSSEFTPGYGALVGARPDLNDLEYFEADRTRLEEFAVFGEIGYDITDAWSITIGGRYYDYSLETANSTEFPLFVGPDFNPYPLSDIENQLTLTPNQSRSGELFKVNTAYKFGDGNTVYATFSQGFRVGETNGGQPCPDVFMPGGQGLCLLGPGQQFSPDPNDIFPGNERFFEPDTVNSYEIGAKTTWLDGDLILNAALFFIDWKDPQIAATSINAGTSITVNGVSAESKGFEFSGSWRVTDNFRLSGNFSYTDAKLTADVPGLVQTIQPPGFGTSLEAGQDGDRLPGSPKTQFSVFGEYRVPLESGADIVVNGSYAWQGNVLTVIGGRGGSFTLPSYGRADIAVGYQAERWSLTAYANNLFNDFSESSASNTPLNNQTILTHNVRRFRTNVLPPRSFGLRAKFKFQ
ncbi:TonB-dependent receptor [Parasphingorhabdus sp.]|uniref:TonB-dependent receptor n=1 Tax=Parasphingorhabdus sp. TaxID=2709688 RepID=UPI00326331E0